MSHDCNCKPACQPQGTTGDGVEASKASRSVFNRDAVSWLVGQGIRHLHHDDAEGEHALQRVTELLRQSGQASVTIGQALHDADADDHSLRWALLYLLDTVAEPRAAEVFFRAAAEPVPARERYPRGCETPRDGEVLVRTMAIAGLARLARHDRDVQGMLLKLLDAQPERALRVETVKALLEADRGHAERIRSMLPQELHFALDLEHVRAEALAVEHDVARQDSTARIPSLDRSRLAPRSHGCGCC